MPGSYIVDNMNDEMKKDEFVAYTVIDADTQERFATNNYIGIGALDRAQRRVAELNLKYGKEFALRVAGITANGTLHEIE